MSETIDVGIEKSEWVKLVRRYHAPSSVKSVFQLVNTIVPYFAIWYCMVRALEASYGLTLLLAIPASLLVSRLMVLQHDCGHMSFFRSRRANEIAGHLCSLMTFMPFDYWRRMHALHHSTSGDLEHRGKGDYPTMTVSEYQDLSPKQQRGYRKGRHPLMMFLVTPTVGFLLAYRFDYMRMGTEWKKECRGLVWTNCALLTVIGTLMFVFGWKTYLLVQLPISFFASTVAGWVFFVQHHHDHALWTDHDEWDYTTAALHGSSYLKLPRILQWCTASIGFHHIHHLSTKIPNYLLEKCHDENPELHPSSTLTLGSSFDCLGLDLWDEENGRLISFKEFATRDSATASQLQQGADENARRSAKLNAAP